jgi:hypothetical protein
MGAACLFAHTFSNLPQSTSFLPFLRPHPRTLSRQFERSLGYRDALCNRPFTYSLSSLSWHHLSDVLDPSLPFNCLALTPLLSRWLASLIRFFFTLLVD